MRIPAEMLRRLVTTPEGSTYRAPTGLSAEGADRILEIAWLSVASDGHLADEELDALRVVGAQLCELAGQRAEEKLSPAALDDVLARVASLDSKEEVVERLRVLSAALASDAERHLAYKLAVGLMLSDLAVNEAEAAFEDALLDALGIDEDVAERLDAEVQVALTPEP
jgi:hypothetical protein